jgi:hypothetical protein
VNRVRFTLFDRYTNSAFDAKPFSITGNPLQKIGTYDERVGGTIGGPLKIPHVYNGSDKTYFFINYQHDIAKNGVNTFSSVPTLAQRNGQFCGKGPVFLPFSTTTTFPTFTCPDGSTGYQIPAADFANNTAVQGLLGFIPLPNQATASGQNYLLQSTIPSNSDVLNTHILHTINSKWNVNGGYNLSSQTPIHAQSGRDARAFS